MAHHGHKGHHHRKHGGHMGHHAHRKHGGEMEPKAMKPENTDAQEEEFLKDSEHGEHFKHGGAAKKHHHARKHGGHIPGHHAKHRPDRKARGGHMSESSPFSTAGKMSAMPFEKKEAANKVEGTGPDRD